MKGKQRTKEFFRGKRFFEGISFWQKQIAGLEKLRSSLRRSEAKMKKFPQELHQQVEIKTAADRIIIKQLHEEIEQRKNLQEILQHSEIRFRRLFEAAQDGILILDEGTGRIVEVNKFLMDMLGYSHEELLGKKLWEIGAVVDIDKCKAVFAQLQAKGCVRYEDMPLKTKGGRLVNVEFVSNVYKADRMKVIQCNIRDITERKKLEEMLKVLASRDELTGCVNFRSTMELLEKEVTRSRRYQDRLSVGMIDIDDFKEKNDTYGHQAGNDILAAFADVVKNSLRSIDSVGRYGGEEFLVILPETDAPQARVVLERIRSNLEKTKMIPARAENAKEVTLTFSAGVAAFPDNAEDVKELIHAADNALLRAKKEGKDRTVLERRRSVRLSPASGAGMEMGVASGKESAGILRIADISREGMLFFSAGDVPGEEFLCRIHCPPEERPFELACKVKHKEKAGQELYRVGVYFPDCPESGRERLSRCMGTPPL